MKFYKLKKNNDVFKFETLNFTDDLKLTDDSKNELVNYLNSIIEEIDVKNSTEFISCITEYLNIDNDKNIGNTIDIHTTNKKIYQMCYLESSKDDINFFGTIINNKRKIINGDVFIFANSLLTTKIVDKTKTLDYISSCDININDIIEIILNNYYFEGLYFDGERYGKYLFDNNLNIISPLEFKGIELKNLLFKRSDILNFTIDVFYDEIGNKLKEKYNRKLGLFYDENFKNKIFIALKSESKNYESILNDYIQQILILYEKFLYDDEILNIPKELKFYDYQDNDKYTNKYIVFDNLYEQVVAGVKKINYAPSTLANLTNINNNIKK